MEKTRCFTLPKTNIQTLAAVAELDFFDTQSTRLSTPLTPLEAWRLIMDRPMPFLKAAFRVRDAISAQFGVRRIGGFSGIPRTTVTVGERLDFFLVEQSSPDVLTLTDRDRHLDVMTCISTCNALLTITSSVITHNVFGRIYMLPVAPAHRLIVRNMLKRVSIAGMGRHLTPPR